MIQIYKGWVVDMEEEYVKKSDYLAALAEERARIVSGQFMQICGYCGEEMQPPSQREKLQDHIQKCPKHPLAKAKEQIAALTSDNAQQPEEDV